LNETSKNLIFLEEQYKRHQRSRITIQDYLVTVYIEKEQKKTTRLNKIWFISLFCSLHLSCTIDMSAFLYRYTWVYAHVCF